MPTAHKSLRGLSVKCVVTMNMCCLMKLCRKLWPGCKASSFPPWWKRRKVLVLTPLSRPTQRGPTHIPQVKTVLVLQGSIQTPARNGVSQALLGCLGTVLRQIRFKAPHIWAEWRCDRNVLLAHWKNSRQGLIRGQVKPFVLHRTWDVSLSATKA